MKSKKLNYILNDSGARAIITDTTKTRIVNDAINDTVDTEHIIWVSPKQSKGILEIDPSYPQPTTRNMQKPTHYLWNDIFSIPSALRLAPYASPNIDVDLATIIYTSGSSGEPKGVMSAHYNVVAAAKSITQYLENVEDDIILDALPLSFDYGLYQVLMAFFFAGTVVLEKSFVYSSQTIKRMVDERVTGFPIVPTMAAILLQMEDLSKFDLNALRYITSTAAMLPTACIRELQSLLPHVKIYSMYGLTECKRVSYLPPVHLECRADSVGIPMPNVEVFVVNKKGQELEPGEVGELVVRGSNVMQGYWNDPRETARVFHQGRYRGDSLLSTGDLFRKDEEGFLYFIARKDDIFKSKGERVSPKEIENILCEIDGVVESTVIGVPDKILGQAIKALIVAKDGNGPTKDQVMTHCMKNLEPFLVPKYVEFTDSLPKSPNGKIDKNELKYG